MTEIEKRKHRACFTGHRPEKLSEPEHLVKQKLKKAIFAAIQNGYTTYISGVSKGVDLWAAKIVLRFRRDNPKIHLICAVPFRGFENLWAQEWKLKYNQIIQNADVVRFICTSYSPSCFQIRNQWMVDRSSLVLAVFNGEKGGTRNTIEYARKIGIRCQII